MTAPRPHPFELLLGGFRESYLPAIRAGLRGDSDIHAFVLAAPVLELLRELRPDGGLGDAVDDFVALVHAGYLFWREGERTVTLNEGATRQLCHIRRGVVDRSRLAVASARYIQVAPRMVWGQLTDTEPFEPLDGWFTTACDAGLRVVACFGVHAQRPGLSVVTVEGRCPVMAERTDGTPLFAPTMPGGDAAHLFAVTDPAELLLLGWCAPVGEEATPWP